MNINNKKSYSQKIVTYGAILGGFGIVFGAFGAHALKGRLDQLAMAGVWDTAVKYQMYHALALVALAAWVEAKMTSSKPGPGFEYAVQQCANWYLAGVILFSGSLYALALGAPSWCGVITPLGGLALIGGWIWLMVAARRNG
jgi:uncharacterized membrane protein YgdD (TMEM256/DUF423 family)